MEFEFDVFDLDPEYLLSYQEDSKQDRLYDDIFLGDFEFHDYDDACEYDCHFMTNEQIRGEE